MKKKGFTSAELLAVFIILALFFLITIPIILNVIKDAKEKAAEDSYNSYIKDIENLILNDDIKEKSLTKDSKGCYKLTKLDKLIDTNGFTPKIVKEDKKINNLNKICVKNDDITYISPIIIDGYRFLYMNGDITIHKESKSKKLRKEKDSDKTSMPRAISTTNSITVINRQKISSKKISKIEYAIKKSDNKTWGKWIDSFENIYMFTDLKNNTSYDIKTRIKTSTSREEFIESKVLTIKTKDQNIPIYKLDNVDDWASKRTLTITFDGNLENSYSIDGGESWIKVDGNIVEIPFINSGNIITRSLSKTNYKNAITYRINKIDSTPPTDTKPSATKTTNSISIYNQQFDKQSKIKKIEYAIYKNNNWIWQDNNVFGKLKNNTIYKIKTRVENKAGLTQESLESSVKTEDIQIPTYTLRSENNKKILTITYSGNFDHDYSIDNGQTWIKANGTTVSIDFTDNGSVIARSYDKNGYKASSSYEVNGIMKGIGIPSKKYNAGDSVKYAGLDWLVIGDNGDTTTLILKKNYKVGEYGMSVAFESGNNAYDQLNNEFTKNTTIKSEIKKKMIVKNTISNSYVRLPFKNELSSKIKNYSKTNFWTMEASGNEVYYATSNGNTQYQDCSLGDIIGEYYIGIQTLPIDLPLEKIKEYDFKCISNPTKTSPSNKSVIYHSIESKSLYGSTDIDTYTPSRYIENTNTLNGTCDLNCSNYKLSGNKCEGYICNTKTNTVSKFVSIEEKKGSISYCGGKMAYTLPSINGNLVGTETYTVSEPPSINATCSGSGVYSNCKCPNSITPKECHYSFKAIQKGSTYQFASPKNCSLHNTHVSKEEKIDMGIRPVITVRENKI